MSGVLVAAVLTPRPRYLLRHTFSGAALTPSDLGPALTSGDSPVVGGGVLTKNDANNDALVCRLGVADLVVQWKTNFGNSAGTDRRSQVRVRHDTSVSRYNFVLSRTGGAGGLGALIIQRFDTPTTTNLASVDYTVADSTNYWTRAVIIGSRLEILASTDGSTFTSLATVIDTTYLTTPAGNDFELDLVDNVASPTITVDDLLVWSAS